MTAFTAQNTESAAVEAEEFVSPCGCAGCEKWADCYYCDHCTEVYGLPTPEEAEEDARLAAEEALPFAEWLASREEAE